MATEHPENLIIVLNIKTKSTSPFSISNWNVIASPFRFLLGRVWKVKNIQIIFTLFIGKLNIDLHIKSAGGLGVKSLSTF